MATHVHDLIAMALGPTRDGRAVVLQRGVRAARLKAIKDDVVQLLFEIEGTTFTDFALDQRLKRAYRMLTGARYVGWTISAIAYEAGFGDLSHFNRNFRRRFSASPSDVRAGASHSAR